MVTDKILIEENDIKIAQDVCNSIDNQDTRNRSVANVLACNIAAKYFDEKYDVDIDYSLHNISNILEDIDISDIYVNGNYVDVRLFFNDNELSVPKSHFDNNILPVAYMFIKVTPDLSSGEVVGFIKPKDVDITNEISNSYVVNVESLNSIYDVENSFDSNVIIEDVEDIELYSLIDNSIQNKYELYKKLLTSKKARYKLLKIISAQSAFSSVKMDLQENTPQESSLIEQEFNGIEDDFDDLITDMPLEQSSDDKESITEDLEYDSISESDLENTDNMVYSTEVSPSLENVMDESSDENEDINTLYEKANEEESPKNIVTNKNKKSPLTSVLGLILFIVLLGYGGYYGYNYFNSNSGNDSSIQNEEELNIEEPVKQEEVASQPDAMPVETVEKVNKENDKNIGNSVEIPAIEQNLNASVIVANLKVDWEVPDGYITNTAAKRSLIKLGKIIQLNLKSDLMLANKIPITNKILVEVKYNKDTRKFEAVGFIKSSGESSIDNIILKTVNNVLKSDISGTTDIFGKLQGDPVLIINL